MEKCPPSAISSRRRQAAGAAGASLIRHGAPTGKSDISATAAGPPNDEAISAGEKCPRRPRPRDARTDSPRGKTPDRSIPTAERPDDQSGTIPPKVTRRDMSRGRRINGTREARRAQNARTGARDRHRRSHHPINGDRKRPIALKSIMIRSKSRYRAATKAPPSHKAGH